MSSSSSFCGICDIRHISKPSEVWCPDCEEGLCTECIEYHSLVKLSRNHATIPIEGYQKLRRMCWKLKNIVTNTTKSSIYTVKNISNFENHKDCKNVTIMEELIKNVKTSTMFTDIEHLMKDMIEIISKIRQNREANSSSVKEQKRIIENDIHELRTKINNHLDKLQEDRMKQLTEAEQQATDETRKLLVSLDEKQKELTEYQKNAVNIKKYASDLQTFLALKQIEKEVETQDTCLQSLVNSDSLNQAKLSYKIDSGLKTIATNIQKFSEVVVESKLCEMNLVKKKDKQAQMIVASLLPPMSVDNIQLKLKQKINIKGQTSTGCCLFSDGGMVFSCSQANTVSFISKEGVELFQIGKDKTGSNTCDTVYIKENNSVAVSSGDIDNRCITIIDRESQKVMTTISMDTYIYGMVEQYITVQGVKARRCSISMINL